MLHFLSQRVIEVSKQFLPKMACSFSNPKLTLHIKDGFEFMGEHKGEFDVIITDSSDPIGNANCCQPQVYSDLLCTLIIV